MRTALLGVAIALVVSILPVTAQAVTDQYQLNIPRQPLDAALKDLAKQAGVQIARFSDVPHGGIPVVGPVSGNLSVGQALTAILNKTGLTYKVVNDRTIAVVAPGAGSASPSRQATSQLSGSSAEGSGEGDKSSLWNRFLLAQAGQGVPSGSTAPPAPAQNAEANNEKAPLEEIVVTATYREQKLQDVPSSIGVITGTELLDRGAAQFEDYLIGQPSVVFVPGFQNNYFFLRGVSAGTALTATSTVGVYIDEAPVSQTLGGTTDLSPFDLNRVEILRGPQGTLFGAGALGGVIRLIMNQPKLDTFEGGALTRFTSIDGSPGVEADAMVNAPLLNDVAAVRITAGVRYDSGWISDVPLGERDINSQRFKNVRGAFLFQPAANLDITAAVTYESQDYAASNNVTVGLPYPGFTGAPYSGYESGNFIPEEAYRPSLLYSLTANYNFDWAKLTSATNFFHKEGYIYRDLTPFFPTLIPQNVANATYTYLRYNSENFTQEFRLASSLKGPFQFLVGAFYAVGFPQHGRIDFYGPQAEAIFGPNSYADERGNAIQLAGFGELNYNITDDLEVTVGLRVSRYEQTQYDALNNPTYANQVFTDPKYSLSYKFDPNSMVYATVASGSRQGSPQTSDAASLGDVCEAVAVQVFGPGGVPTVQPDKLWNYELGSKNTFGSWILNGAAFFEKWSRMQTQVNLAGACMQGVDANAGESEIKGAELELDGKPTDDFEIQGGVSYTHTAITEGVPAIGASVGSWLPLIPRWTGNVAATYKVGTFGSARGYLRADFRYNSAYYMAFQPNTAAFQLPGYNTIGLRAGMHWKKYDAALYVQNLGNNFTYAVLDPPNTTTNRLGTVLQPRTLGLELRAEF